MNPGLKAHLILATFFALFIFSARATTVYVDVNSTNPVSPYVDWLTAATNIQDAVDVSVDSDTVLVTNGFYAFGGRSTYRVYVDRAIFLTSVNGLQDTSILVASGGRGVHLTNGASMAGFTITNVNLSGAGGRAIDCTTNTIVISNCFVTGPGYGVKGGTYYNCTISNCFTTSTGSQIRGGAADSAVLNNCLLISNSCLGRAGAANQCRLTDCVLVGNKVSLQSIGQNPDAGRGGAAYGSTLYNCIISNNWAEFSGGGLELCNASNCWVVGNTAGRFGGGVSFGLTLDSYVLGNTVTNGSGGGAYNAILTNCLVFGNSVKADSGGAHFGGVVNCTVVSNYAGGYGGGASGNATVINSILYYNTAGTNGNNYFFTPGSVSHTCSFPLNAGVGNITNAPAFIDLAGGNLRLQSNSACIDTGDNTGFIFNTDLDGRPRIVNGPIDLGAYECQGPGMGQFIAWLQSFNLPVNGSADHTDPDADAMDDWQEWIAGTSPTDALSLLKILSVSSDVAGTAINWSSVTNRTYFLTRGSDLGVQPSCLPVQSNLVGQAGSTTFIDTTTPPGPGPYFYQVAIQQ